MSFTEARCFRSVNTTLVTMKYLWVTITNTHTHKHVQTHSRTRTGIHPRTHTDNYTHIHIYEYILISTAYGGNVVCIFVVDSFTSYTVLSTLMTFAIWLPLNSEHLLRYLDCWKCGQKGLRERFLYLQSITNMYYC